MIISTTERKALVERIKGKLNNVHCKGTAAGMGDWTTIFFDPLTKLGIEQGYTIYSSKSNALNTISPTKVYPGWLFDLCWSKDDDSKRFYGLSFVCESEWKMNQEEILHDFHKLCVVRADIKLMIFQFDDFKFAEEVKRFCEASVDSDMIDKNETYLLFGSGNMDSEDSFYFKHLFVSVED